MTFILEHDEGNVSSRLSLNIRYVAIKWMSLWKNKQDFLSHLYKVRQPSELEVKFILKCDQLWGKGWANIPPKGPQTWLVPGGGGSMNYVNDDDDDVFADDADDYDVFSWS